MGELDGVLRRQYEVHCLKCEAAALGLGSNYRDAGAELRLHWGWSLVRNRWFCDDCTAWAKTNFKALGPSP